MRAPDPAAAPTPRPHLPFSSVVGQDEAKLALLLVAVEPRLGGVLLRGDKGSAKTTLARGLAPVLGADAPFVELPLGATPERVVGSVDVAALLEDRHHAFRPGLLAAAHGGVLYVDEINLLADHLVDTLLDVAVSGVNKVERDGLSESHPARFVLVGSMNPEEGELRPQLLDRFGLTCEVRASSDIAVRAEIVRRQLAFERSGAPQPAALDADEALRATLGRVVPAVLSDATLDAAARLSVAVGAEGLRADLSLCRAASALAGWEGRGETSPDDLRPVAALVLAHRRRRDPFETPGLSAAELEDALRDALGAKTPPEGPVGEHPVPPQQPSVDGTGQGADGKGDPAAPAPAPGKGAASPAPDNQTGPSTQTVSAGTEDTGGDVPSSAPGDIAGGPGVPHPGGADIPPGRPDGGDPPPVRIPLPVPASSLRGPAGRGAPGTNGDGRVLRSVPLAHTGQRLAVTETVVAHATRTAGAAASLVAGDLRANEAEGRRACLVILAVDASGSMTGRRRLDAARGAVLGLLGDAYRRRDRVAMIVFRGATAEVVMRPTASVEIARARLSDLATGGTTPLASGLQAVTALVRSSRRSDGPEPVVVLITDGRATAGGADPLRAAHEAAVELSATGVRSLVLDAEQGSPRLDLARALAADLGGDYVALESLGGTEHGAVERAIRDRLPGHAGQS